jgi:hypothetical protein
MRKKAFKFLVDRATLWDYAYFENLVEQGPPEVLIDVLVILDRTRGMVYGRERAV